MFLDEYQKQAVATAVYPISHLVIYPALGLAGEAGEIANKVKKVLRDDNGVVSEERRQSLKGEIGDALWYSAALARDLGFTLGEIAEENIAKLKSRQVRGVIQGEGDNR